MNNYRLAACAVYDDATENPKKDFHEWKRKKCDNRIDGLADWSCFLKKEEESSEENCLHVSIQRKNFFIKV